MKGHFYSAGAGRTGAFIGFDILKAEGESVQKVDVYGCILNMRRQRVHMVQTSVSTLKPFICCATARILFVAWN